MSILLHITLGNPLQECRQFGICRMELWDGAPLNDRQCLARAEAQSTHQLSLLFLHKYLRPPLRHQHFTPDFLIEAPCPLPAYIAPNRQSIRPGRYAVQKTETGLQVIVNIGHAQDVKTSGNDSPHRTTIQTDKLIIANR